MERKIPTVALAGGFTLTGIVEEAAELLRDADFDRLSGCGIEKTPYHAAIAERIDHLFHYHEDGDHEDDPSGLHVSNDSATGHIETPTTESAGALADGIRQGASGSADHGVRNPTKVPMPLMSHFQPSSISIRSSRSAPGPPGTDAPFAILSIGSGYEAEDTDSSFDYDGQGTDSEDASEQNDADGMSESEVENGEQDAESDSLSDGVSEVDSDVEDDHFSAKSFEMQDDAGEPLQSGVGITAAALIAESEAEDTDCVIREGLPTPRASATPEFEYPITALEHIQHTYVVELRDTRAPSASISALETESVAISDSHERTGSNGTETALSRDDVIKASDQETHGSQPRMIMPPLPMLDFPTETLLHIMSYLCLTQILQYRRVCKHFRQLIDNKSNLSLLLAKLPLQTSMLDKLASVQNFDILQFDYLETLAELVARRGLWPNKDPYILTIHITMDLFMRCGVQVNDAVRAVTWDAFWKLGYNIWQIHIQHHLPHRGLRCMNWVPCIDVSEFVHRAHCPVLEAYGITEGKLTKWYDVLTKTPGGYLRGLTGPRETHQVARWGGPEIPQFCLTGLYAFDSGTSSTPTSVTLRNHYRPPITADASKCLAKVLGIAELPTHFEAYGQLFSDGYVFAWCARSRNVYEKVKVVLTEDGGRGLTALEIAIIKEDLYLV